MPSKTKNRKLRQWFKIQKWKWYVVDTSDWHKPVLVRKHLDNKKQAIRYRDKYYPEFDVIYYKDALEMGLRDFINKKKTHTQHTAKYEYPLNKTTQAQRHSFRNNERKKMKQKKRMPKLTETVVWEMIDDKPVFFMKQLKKFIKNHWAYSRPVEGLKVFKEKYEWPQDVVLLSNIVRCLKTYYDVGLYDVSEVAMFIYEKWGDRVRRHMRTVDAIPIDKEAVAKELGARGFMKKLDMDFDDDDSYIESIYLNPTLAHPEICRHLHKEINLYDYSVYDFQSKMGIPGFVRAHVSGLEKRR